jgi:hypothetical protein
MKIASAAARVRMAEANLVSAERALVASARPWRWRMQRHRSALLLCGGFASGLALTFFPRPWWARIGAFAGAAAATAARSAFTPGIIGALLAHIRRGNDAAEVASPPSSPPSAE